MDRAIGVVVYAWKEAGEKVCRLLLPSGLLDPCLELGLEEKSRSVLLACCTNGLVGGRSANELVDDCDVALALETARGSWPKIASKEYEVSLCWAG
jgi:hypothetical protein